MNKHLFVFLGAPGSGKGTLSQELISRYNWDYLSTGDLCRRHITQKTDVGKKIDFTIKSGKLVPDSLIMQMVNQWFLENKNHTSAVLLDGVPRTLDQAKSLLQFLNQEVSELKLHVIHLSISDKVVIERLGKRYICSNRSCNRIYSDHEKQVCDYCSSSLLRRTDDTETTVQERLSMFHLHENDLLNFYQKQGVPVFDINADQTRDKVLEDLESLIEKIAYDNGKK